MVHLLYKYLISHNYVKIPGIGHFSLEKQPARLNLEEQVIHAPVSIIKYKEEADVADKSFYNFLATELNIDVVDAVRQFQDFSFRLKNNITTNKIVELPSFGTLQLVNKHIDFQQAPLLADYYPDISIDKSSSFYQETVEEEDGQIISEEDYEEERQARSYWWLYALILALIGAGAIFYYYYYLGNDYN